LIRTAYKIKAILIIAAAYIAIVGLITYSLFILEESIQMITFGTWPAQDAKNWRLVLQGCDAIEATNRTLKIINYSVGWVQPLAFISYRSYAKATDYYVKALKNKVFAHEPEALIGREIETILSLRSARVEETLGGWVYHLRGGNLCLFLKEKPTDVILQVTGIVEKKDDAVFITSIEDLGDIQDRPQRGKENLTVSVQK